MGQLSTTVKSVLASARWRKPKYREKFKQSSEDNMKPSSLLSALCAGLFVVASSSASAAIITVNSNVSNGLYTDTVFSGLFDLAPYLSSPTYNAPFVINSASIDFGFSDNDDTLIYDGYNNHTYYYSDPSESVALDLSGESASGSTLYSSNVVQTGTEVYGTYSCGAFNASTCYTYGPIYTNTSGYNGVFDIMQALTGSGLAAVTSTGMLNFTGSVTGSLNLNSATLTIDVTPNPVPLPAALWLFGSGLVGLVGIGARRR